ncbi:MAG TPA: hypothetical protein VNV17_24285 [Solirubrobacteraceae bacterium]|nr:hypothetical protein [Solirubrobacteraceae bacterium]
MSAGRQWVWPPAVFPSGAEPTLARGAWQLDPERSNPYIRFTSRTARLEGERLSVVGDLTARGSRIAVEIDATVAAVDGEYELEAETFVMHSGLGMKWNRGQITRPWSRLSVSGRLVRVPVAPETPRMASPGRRLARTCRGTSP